MRTANNDSNKRGFITMVFPREVQIAVDIVFSAWKHSSDHDSIRHSEEMSDLMKMLRPLMSQFAQQAERAFALNGLSETAEVSNSTFSVHFLKCSDGRDEILLDFSVVDEHRYTIRFVTDISPQSKTYTTGMIRLFVLYQLKNHQKVDQITAEKFRRDCLVINSAE